ncbi:MAG: CoA transferase [Dehalococcoidia bacterium]|nr:CoA transferase [Dehalococcoidia bacterium]
MTGEPRELPAEAGPLAGLRVVEYGDLVTAPYASKVLADLGATVLKIEAPRSGDRSRVVGPFPGDLPDPERSGLFIYLNAKKRGVTLDLGCSTGRAIFARLIADADVLIENVAPPDAARLGLAHEQVRRLNDHLIHLSITPFGHTGPYSAHKGYGLNVAAMSGVVLANGAPERAPLPLPDFLEDFFTGVVGALSCMLALAGTEGDADGAGTGEWIDLSGANAWMTFQTGMNVVSWVFNGRRTRRQGRHSRGGGYPYAILPCKDGYVRLIAMQRIEWTRFVQLMGTPEWSSDERFQDRLKMNELYADELNALIDPWLTARTKAELQQLFYTGRVPFTAVKDFRDVLEDPQLRARNFFVDARQPGMAPMWMPGPPYHLATEVLGPWRPAPTLGEHNDEVFGGQLTINRDDMVALEQAGVI